MVVRAKFYVTAKTDRVFGPGGQKTTEVEFSAVSGDTPENKGWAKYTPSGQIRMCIDNPNAVDAFVLGKAYFVDFTEATNA